MFKVSDIKKFIIFCLQLFDDTVIAAMKVFHKNSDKYPTFEKAGPTIAFIEKINKLIKAMTSRTPENALRIEESCTQKKV